MRANRRTQRRVNYLRRRANALGMRTKSYSIHKGAILLPFSYGELIGAICEKLMPLGTRIKFFPDGIMPASPAGDLPSGIGEVAPLPLPKEDDPDYASFWNRATDAYLQRISSGPSRRDTHQDRVGPDKASPTT